MFCYKKLKKKPEEFNFCRDSFKMFLGKVNAYSFESNCRSITLKRELILRIQQIKITMHVVFSDERGSKFILTYTQLRTIKTVFIGKCVEIYA